MCARVRGMRSGLLVRAGHDSPLFVGDASLQVEETERDKSICSADDAIRRARGFTRFVDVDVTTRLRVEY